MPDKANDVQAGRFRHVVVQEIFPRQIRVISDEGLKRLVYMLKKVVSIPPVVIEVEVSIDNSPFFR